MLNSCALLSVSDVDEDPIGTPPRIYFHSWDDLKPIVSMTDTDNLITHLHDHSNVDISCFDTTITTRFCKFICDTDIIAPNQIADVDLLESYYTLDRDQFSFAYRCGDLLYRFNCQSIDQDAIYSSNGLYQSHMREERAKASHVSASIDEIPFQLDWNSDFYWYSGRFVHEGYVYTVCVAKSDNRSLGTPDIAQNWDFELFNLMTLSELFPPVN